VSISYVTITSVMKGWNLDGVGANSAV
jgi:hypothetical protein